MLSISLCQSYEGYPRFLQVDRMRDLMSGPKVGQLVTFKATVTQTAQLEQEIVEASYDCGMCGTQVSVAQHSAVTLPNACTNANCDNRCVSG